MADRLAEDIAALCSRTGIDTAHYKEFAAPQRAAVLAAREQGQKHPDPEVQSKTAVDGAGGPSEEEAAVEARATPESFTEEDEAVVQHTEQSFLRRFARPGAASRRNTASGRVLEIPRTARTASAAMRSEAAPAVAAPSKVRWVAMHDVLSQPAAAESPAVGMLKLPRGSIALSSVGGGVGRTTIAATLARLLTRAGESVFLAGSDSHSVLPLYFGARSLSGGALRTFLTPHAQNTGSLHLYVDSDGSGDGETAGGDNPQLARILSQMEVVKGDADRVIILSPGGQPEPWMPVLRAASICLEVIVPDVASVIGVGRFNRYLEEQQRRTGHTVAAYFLLNKFDGARALHNEMREGLRQQLRSRLLPFTIRRSDEIPEALAAGMTVLDYAPEAGVVEDFEHLADWVGTFAHD